MSRPLAHTASLVGLTALLAIAALAAVDPLYLPNGDDAAHRIAAGAMPGSERR
jgi:hypothetical protein